MTNERKQLYNKINNLIDKHIDSVDGIYKEELKTHQNIYTRYLQDLEWIIRCYDSIEREEELKRNDSNHLIRRIKFELEKQINNSIKIIKLHGIGFKYKDENIKILEEVLKDVRGETV